MALNLNLRVSARARAQLSYIQTLVRPTWRKKLAVCYVYIEVADITKRSKWMKGICHEWSRGRHFFPSLPGNRYLKLGSKSDLRAEISWSIVWYNALATRPEVLRSSSPFYGNLW